MKLHDVIAARINAERNLQNEINRLLPIEASGDLWKVSWVKLSPSWRATVALLPPEGSAWEQVSITQGDVDGLRERLGCDAVQIQTSSSRVRYLAYWDLPIAISGDEA